MLREFREFIMKGNALDMAIGIVLGVAFGAIIVSLGADILLPPIGLLLGGLDFTNLLQATRCPACTSPLTAAEGAR